MRRTWVLALAGWVAVLMAGCGTVENAAMSGQPGKSSGRDRAHPLVFQNLTGEMNEGQDPRWDPQPASSDLYGAVTVWTATGQKELLSADAQPLLFAAYWCPHCQRTLELLTSIRQRLKRDPVIVNVGYPAGTSLKTAVRIAREEDATLHLAPFKEVFVLTPSAGDRYAPLGYPTLVFRQGNDLWSLYGQHRAAVWEKALS
ncbi:TlpA family protein disulfide reductase [Alicyclobacillus mali (ex Roth et al. 2021)]|uniref:TlpA family protein disulfide reductase n=1 Tax=Alicyclobacillus mali (ex Roth et al. 2021) TaxID=1123961 RepID=UPI001A8F2520|nr:hypothetical protein [Alicyclobacillus mali (ex Roth et al. 2021)]